MWQWPTHMQSQFKRLAKSNAVIMQKMTAEQLENARNLSHSVPYDTNNENPDALNDVIHCDRVLKMVLK
jgi:hypothetical protein